MDSIFTWILRFTLPNFTKVDQNLGSIYKIGWHKHMVKTQVSNK